MPYKNNPSIKGDLIIKFDIFYPKKINHIEKEIIKKYFIKNSKKTLKHDVIPEIKEYDPNTNNNFSEEDENDDNNVECVQQ